MIGLTFLAAGLLWLAFSIFVGRKLPRWLGIRNRAVQWAVTVAAVVILLIGPFVDHIVGMRQFEKLCAEETRLWVSPNAEQTKRGKGLSESSELLDGYAIPIKLTRKFIIDLDSNEVIARYNYFATYGGRIGPLLNLGGEHVCSVTGPRHIDNDKFVALKNKVSLTYGEAK